MNNFSQKLISIVIAAAATYFGFQALDLISGIFQIHIYFNVAWVIYAFHIFWLTFLFDLHLKSNGHLSKARQKYKGVLIFLHAFRNRIRHLYHWTYLRHYLNYLILPSIMYWSVVILMYLNPFHELFKDALIIVSTVGLSVVYWYFKEAFSHHMELHQVGLKVLSLVKLYSAYLAYTALIALGWYFDLPLSTMMSATFIISFLLLYQTLFQRRLLTVHVYPMIFLFAIMMTLLYAVVFIHWNVNYYSAGLILVVIYNTAWSLLHRYLDKTLTRAILWEYVFMLIVLASLILATQSNQGRI